MIGLLDLRRRIDAGDLRPLDALAAARERVAAGDARPRLLRGAGAAAGGRRPIPARPLAGIAVGVKDIIDTCRPAHRNGAARPCGAAGAAVPTPRSSARCARRAAGSPARPRRPRWPISTRRRPAIRTMPPARPAGRRPVRPRPLRPASCRWPSARRREARSSARRRSAAWRRSSRPSGCCRRWASRSQAWTLDTLGLFGASVDDVAYALEAVCGRPMRLGGTIRARRASGWSLPELGGPPEPDMAAAARPGRPGAGAGRHGRVRR